MGAPWGSLGNNFGTLCGPQRVGGNPGQAGQKRKNASRTINIMDNVTDRRNSTVRSYGVVMVHVAITTAHVAITTAPICARRVQSCGLPRIVHMFMTRLNDLQQQYHMLPVFASGTGGAEMSVYGPSPAYLSPAQLPGGYVSRFAPSPDP